MRWRAHNLAILVVLFAGCTEQPLAQIPYTQDFSAPLGKEWSSQGSAWRVVDGRLLVEGAHNVPLWLSAALPADVRVAFDAESLSDAVDIKFEIFGDGQNHESGYIIILAGWNNSRSIIARLAEHGERHNPVRNPSLTESMRREVAEDAGAARARHRDRKEIIQRMVKMQPRHRYRMRFERKGNDLRLFVDDQLHLELFDPSPLSGKGNDRFAFNNWDSQVFFDNLRIEAL